ncbi:MAG: hypothetical protein ABIZ04_25680 [Opitutus sp.]
MSLLTLLATSVVSRVPDSGASIALVSGGVLTLGLFARYLKSRKK